MTTVLDRAASAKSAPAARRKCRRCERHARPGSRYCRCCRAEVDARKRLRFIAEWDCPELMELAADWLDVLVCNRGMFPDPMLERIFDDAVEKARRIFLAPAAAPACVRVVRDPRIPPLGDDDLDLPF